MSKEQRKMLIRIIITAVMFATLNIFKPENTMLCAFLYLAAYLIIGYDILLEAFSGITEGEVFDENFLMAVATLGAIALGIYQKNSEYNEAVAVMLFYQVGELFQSYAVDKSRRNISELMDIRPDYANIERDGKLYKVSPDEIKPGSIIVVQPGEKIPIDGIVEEGESSVDARALTGESIPQSVNAGDSVTSGCINMTGLLKIRTSKEFGESTVSKILQLMENSGQKKARSENFISKFAGIYTPIVCFCALALAVLPPVFRMLFMKTGAEWGVWIYRALTFLVISCPCALVISIPLTFFAGIGGAGKKGILIKGSNYVETLSKVKTVVFDKTGTLTKGVFEVNAVHHNALEEKRLLEYAALAECSSSHPISKSLERAYGGEIDRSRVSKIEEISGEGITAVVDDTNVAAGNSKLMDRLGIKYIDCHRSGTIVHMAIGGEYAGHIVISDVEKPESKEAVAELKAMGIEKTVMLTGDSQKAAGNVARNIGIDEFHAQLLPVDKVKEVERLLDVKSTLAFVGDGINDAPVLSRADVGIAMGAMGSDAAIEAADVVLMDDNPKKIAAAVKLSKKCIAIVYENIVFALGIKALCLILGAVGIANMWTAVFADVGVMVIAVINAVRALR